jgi:hypothetical protein
MVYTGFAMDAETFANSPIEEQDPIQCPACHQMHKWRKRDAILERDSAAPSTDR